MAKTKDELIQEVQNKGLEFDGNMTVSELQDVLDREANYVDSPVAPVKSVDDAPNEPVTGATMRCWNCANQGTKTRLPANGICTVCGFDVNQVYNGNIEAARSAEKAVQISITKG